jgi:microsomal prostaglandin-E synthase 2
MFQSARLSNRAVGVLSGFRKCFSTTGLTPPPSITLFQYEICPFCNINKTLLSYANVDYNVTEVNPLTKSEIKFSKEYKKVPIALINDVQVNGSKEINDALLKLPAVIDNLSSKNDMPLEDFVNSPSAQKWETFARDELAPILYPNICR